MNLQDAQFGEAVSEPGIWRGDDRGSGGYHLAVVQQLLAGAELLPSQLPSAWDWSPEKELAAAVLAFGLMDIRDRRGDGRDCLKVTAALAWVKSDDTQWPFSFLRLCDLFALDPAWVREQVEGWLRQEATGPNRNSPYRHAA